MVLDGGGGGVVGVVTGVRQKNVDVELGGGGED